MAGRVRIGAVGGALVLALAGGGGLARGAAVAGEGPGGAGASAGVYRGATAQEEPVTIVIARGGVVEDASAFRSTAMCTGGGSVSSTTHFAGQLQGDAFVLKDDVYRDALSGGGSVVHTVSVRFTVHGARLTGFFGNRAVVKRGGKVIARCATGRVTLRALRGAAGSSDASDVSDASWASDASGDDTFAAGAAQGG